MVLKGVVIENFKTTIFHFAYINNQIDEDNQLRMYATPSLRERINEKDSARVDPLPMVCLTPAWNQYG